MQYLHVIFLSKVLKYNEKCKHVVVGQRFREKAVVFQLKMIRIITTS